MLETSARLLRLLGLLQVRCESGDMADATILERARLRWDSLPA